jgi:hypothetical protein
MTGPEALNLDLEADEPSIEENTDSDLEIEATDELDLSDLDLEVDNASVTDKASVAQVEELDLDLDLDLETESVDDGDETGADELDLSELTGIMEDEEASAAEAQPEELDLELDLDFQDDGNAPSTEAATASQSEDELDFSDLEQMLESDKTTVAEAASSEDDEDLNLQFNPEGPSASGSDAVVAGDAAASAQDDWTVVLRICHWRWKPHLMTPQKGRMPIWSLILIWKANFRPKRSLFGPTNRVISNSNRTYWCPMR